MGNLFFPFLFVLFLDNFNKQYILKSFVPMVTTLAFHYLNQIGVTVEPVERDVIE